MVDCEFWMLQIFHTLLAGHDWGTIGGTSLHEGPLADPLRVHFRLLPVF